MSVYLDYHSTSPVDKRVAEAMKPFFFERFGNPAALHVVGEDAKFAVDEAREQVASIINAKSDDIYFTPSATVANNIVLRGRVNVVDNDGGGEQIQAIIISNTEHASITKCLERIDRDRANTGKYQASRGQVPINNDGTLNYDALEELLKTWQGYQILVSIIAANNEIGTIHDLHKIGILCAKYGALFHTDAVQAIGKVDIDVDAMNIFALTMSGHKIYGPKGIGALYVRDINLIEPLIDGGYQDTLSSGTQNVPGIVGIGKACEILQQESSEENKRIAGLRDLLWQQLSAGLTDIFINGTMKKRLPNNLNITIEGVEAEILVRGMDDVIISGGAACKSGSLDPSHVITALGTSHSNCAFRFGLGRWTTKDDIIYAANRIIEVVNGVRGDNNDDEKD